MFIENPLRKTFPGVCRPRGRFGFKAACLLAGLLFVGLPLPAYIGPGAGFAFLSSFFVLFLTFLLAIFSLLAWPFRALWKLIRGQKAFRGSLVERAVVVGLDGMAPELAEKFMDQGKLPNLARLRAEGFYGRLQTTTPAISPVAWSSFMTGSEPSKHNIFDFLSRDPKTYLPDLSSARISKPKRTIRLGKYQVPISKPVIQGLRRSVPFWKILGEKGIQSTVLRVPITFPPEKFNGHLLSGMCAPDLKGSQGTFSFFTSDPAKIQKAEGGVFFPVEVKGNRVETHLPGPENTMLRVPMEIKLPIRITINENKTAARIEVSGKTFTLKTGEFSPWINLTFKPGLGIKIRAIAKFLVTSLSPHFEMYVTPLNLDPEKPALPISHPFYYSVYLSKLLGSFITLGEANDTWALNEGALDEKKFLELTYSNHVEWEGMLFNALRKMKRGHITIVFETTDSISHMFWRYLDPGHPALKKGPAALGPEVIEDLFVRMDGLIGRVTAEMGPKTALFIMSDHGFKPFRRGVNLNTWLLQNGYLALTDGAEGGEWFKGVDWNRTKAYALGLGGVYVNQKGREAQGTVSADEAKALRKEIQGKLLGLRDPEGNAVAINRAYDKDEIYSGPYKDNGPDLIIGYNIGYRASWEAVTGKVTDRVFEDNPKCWSGDHCVDPAVVPGVLFSNLRLAKPSPSIMDIAPTILELFGLERPGHMDGRSLLPAGTSKLDPAPARKAQAPKKGKKKK
ncbi:MAG: alkaline phosphatase family protein [Candidatus Aminicenantes bacterium]|nr:alkaline phosphatase family protein [Candidatus Aminicenantes bacterium]